MGEVYMVPDQGMVSVVRRPVVAIANLFLFFSSREIFSFNAYSSGAAVTPSPSLSPNTQAFAVGVLAAKDIFLMTGPGELGLLPSPHPPPFTKNKNTFASHHHQPPSTTTVTRFPNGWNGVH